MPLAQLIRLTLLEGVPDGMRMVELAGRTTKLTACPVSTMGKLLKRPEAQKTAVYFLVGQQFETTEPAIYVGECDAASKRFDGKHHAFEKADWQLIVVASTSDAIFNKAHARRVESSLVERAKAAERARVFTERSGPGDLDEGDAAVADSFLADTILLAETLGIDAFRLSSTKVLSTNAQTPTSLPLGSTIQDETAIFRYVGEPSVQAQMRVVGDECIVLAGSTVRLNETDGCPPSVRAARCKAIDLGLLTKTDDGKFLKASADIPTGSSSGAGGLVAGRASRGPTEWLHVGTGQPYGIWLQSKQTETVAP
jgi:hypothetical protein